MEAAAAKKAGLIYYRAGMTDWLLVRQRGILPVTLSAGRYTRALLRLLTKQPPLLAQLAHKISDGLFRRLPCRFRLIQFKLSVFLESD